MHVAPHSEPELDKYLRTAVAVQASDVYLQVGLSPALKLNGVFRALAMAPSSQQDLERLLSAILSVEQQQALDQKGELSVTYVVASDNRFDLCVSKKRGQIALHAHTDAVHPAGPEPVRKPRLPLDQAMKGLPSKACELLAELQVRIDELTKDKVAAVEKQDYELGAHLRDRIVELESQQDAILNTPASPGTSADQPL